MIHQSLQLVNGHRKRHDVLDYPLSALDETLDFSWVAQLTMSRTLGGVKASLVWNDNCGGFACENCHPY